MEGPDVVAVLIVFGLFMLAAAAAGFAGGWFVSDHNAGLSSWDRHYYDDEDDEPHDPEEIAVDVPALPVDPNNPPVSRVYNPQPGSLQKHCSCHDRPLEVGEEVLWWPLPEGKGVRLICKDGLAEAQPA